VHRPPPLRRCRRRPACRRLDPVCRRPWSGRVTHVFLKKTKCMTICMPGSRVSYI
jgi:hypothetical protein